MSYKNIKDKKGFLGTGLAGIVSLFLVFFILLIFSLASAAIAGKINIPVVGKSNQVEIEEGFEKAGGFEIKQGIVSILESPLEDNGKRVKDVIKEKGFTNAGKDDFFRENLRELVNFYFQENYCFKMCLIGDCSSNFVQLEDRGVCREGVLTGMNYGHDLYEEDFLIGDEKIKFIIYLENE